MIFHLGILQVGRFFYTVIDSLNLLKVKKRIVRLKRNANFSMIA